MKAVHAPLAALLSASHAAAAVYDRAGSLISWLPGMGPDPGPDATLLNQSTTLYILSLGLVFLRRATGRR
jgi:hypothetical protein